MDPTNMQSYLLYLSYQKQAYRRRRSDRGRRTLERPRSAESQSSRRLVSVVVVLTVGMTHVYHAQLLYMCRSHWPSVVLSHKLCWHQQCCQQSNTKELKPVIQSFCRQKWSLLSFVLRFLLLNVLILLIMKQLFTLLILISLRLDELGVFRLVLVRMGSYLRA